MLAVTSPPLPSAPLSVTDMSPLMRRHLSTSVVRGGQRVAESLSSCSSGCHPWCAGSPWVCGRGCLFPWPCRDVPRCMAVCESYCTPGCPCESQTIFCSRLGGGREGGRERKRESGSRESDSARVRVTGGRRHNKGGCREAGNSPGSILDWQPGRPGARETLTTGPPGQGPPARDSQACGLAAPCLSPFPPAHPNLSVMRQT